MIRKAKAVWKGTGRRWQRPAVERIRRARRDALFVQDPLREREGDESRGVDRGGPCRLLHHGAGLRPSAAPAFTPTELSTEAAVSLEPEGKGFKISKSALTLRAKVPNLDDAGFARIAGEAEKNCPVSKVLNAEITLDAKLI